MTMLEWLAQGKGELLTAGFLGSVVAAAMEWTGVFPAVRKILVGTISAVYLSPLGLPFLEWVLNGISVPRESAAGMSGFLMGVTGIVVIEIILKAFRIKRDDLNQKIGGQ
ncbi:hypothetical protein GA830_10675 [Mesorhizobium sp. NBSH29]|uniref:hypothetical protein n=1 Tax=Mesorhizobium sp. NBSH29 TaxID=2654249 RepID=UPI00189691F6|nr:hypothetical protein [Mesorhizobium sp. NBSH29]QPC87155.1 hypothetical protein GA830_10675 [Mesorhizobium sp. NBSH29]